MEKKNCVYIDTREDSYDEAELFYDNLESSKYNGIPCVILGTLQLWTGYHKIEPRYEENISDAISACTKYADMFKVSQRNSVTEVAAYHHDGTNHFEIKLLNKKGCEAARRIEHGHGKADLNKKCYHKSMNDYLF